MLSVILKIVWDVFSNPMWRQLADRVHQIQVFNDDDTLYMAIRCNNPDRKLLDKLTVSFKKLYPQGLLTEWEGGLCYTVYIERGGGKGGR